MVRRQADMEGFALPSAWINFGNSPLADGFVTFWCEATTGEKPSDFKCTLTNQAKDYHNDSKLDKAKLNKHAERCNAAVLDGVFGKRRLLCVAGSL